MSGAHGLARGGLLAALAALVLTGCLSSVQVEVLRRNVPPSPLTEPPVVGILPVRVDDSVIDEAPPTFLNIAGLVVKASRDQLALTSIPVVDYADLEYSVPWRRLPQADGGARLSLDALPPLPFGVQTSLVTRVEVQQWRMEELERRGERRPAEATLTLLMSTWTRHGVPVRTEVVHAAAVSGGTIRLESSESAQVSAYLEARERLFMPQDHEALFWAVLREAVGLHFAGFLPAWVPEQYTLVLDGDTEEGARHFQAGRHDEALAAWNQAIAKDRRGAHSALYSAALVHLLRGEDSTALELLIRACNISDRRLYSSVKDEVREWEEARAGLHPRDLEAQREARSSTRVPSGLLARPGARHHASKSSEPAPVRPATRLECFTVEEGPNGDPRWAEGLSLDLDDQLLAEYFPERCRRPDGGCAIATYQITTGAPGKPPTEFDRNRIWSREYVPGQGDTRLVHDTRLRPIFLPEPPSKEVRHWSDFATHWHRYRYCQYRTGEAPGPAEAPRTPIRQDVGAARGEPRR